MAKWVCIHLGALALLVPILIIVQMLSIGEPGQTWWDFYPLFVSGFLLSIVFFFAAYRFHKRQKSSS